MAWTAPGEEGEFMKLTILRTCAVATIAIAFAFDGVSAAPAAVGGAAQALPTLSTPADGAVTQVQIRRRGGGPRVGVAPGRGFRGGGRRGLSTGAAVGLGVGAAALGILGAAAAANAAPPAVVYDDCYWTSRRVYDDWGNYVGRRRVQVCP